mgnify:CR=1 FL=1
MPDRKSPLAPLRHLTYRRIWIASLASNFGGLIQAVGAAWMMTSLSSSENMIALVQASILTRYVAAAVRIGLPCGLAHGASAPSVRWMRSFSAPNPPGRGPVIVRPRPDSVGTS